jgi:hypothetical protein
MGAAGSREAVQRAGAEMADAFSSEAADPFGEATTLVEVGPDLRRQLEFAERLRQAIADMVGAGPLSAGVG